MRPLALVLVIVGCAAAVGFGLAFGVIGLWSAIQGPFQPEWDDTWHERLPVGLAYLTWSLSIVAGLFIAWRVSRRTRRN